jgi:alkylated DNA repair dioxygenase AlkB
MNSLFPIEIPFPVGFSYQEDFLTAEEEFGLLKEIEGLELHNMVFQGFEAKRRVASFGQDWSFEKRTLSKGRDIPAIFTPLINKLAMVVQQPSAAFKELLVTEYPPGSVINWHRDAPPFDLIAGISLLSDCTFRLKPYEKSRQVKGSLISFTVRRRSLYIMKNEAREEWQHSIMPVRQKRFSITVRTLR